MSTAKLIPMIQSLQHAEKLRLMAFLVGEIAREDGVNLTVEQAQNVNSTDALAQLAGMAQPLGASDLARHFDQYTGKVLSDDFAK